MPEEQKSFWSTVPGIITAIATLITAIGGFLVVLNQVGVFGNKSDSKKDESKNVGIVGEQQLQNLGSDEVKQRQAALETKIQEMEARLARQRQQEGSSHATSPNAQHGKANQPSSNMAHIAGTWYDASGAYYTITQAGNQVALEEISNVYGVATRTAAGQGSVIGATAIFNVQTLFGTTGIARVQLSEGMLIGEYKDNVAGTTTYLRLSQSPTNFEDQ